MKQTAVEWLYENILLTPLDIRLINECLEQAKEMEKQQIIDAVEKTIKSIELTEDKKGFFVMGGDGYYNETFKK